MRLMESGGRLLPDGLELPGRGIGPPGEGDLPVPRASGVPITDAAGSEGEGRGRRHGANGRLPEAAHIAHLLTTLAEVGRAWPTWACRRVLRVTSDLLIVVDNVLYAILAR